MMWFQQPDVFALVQVCLECGPDHLLKWFERSDLYLFIFIYLVI